MPDEIADELDGIDLGDQRLNRRSQRLLEALAADPQASVHAASHGWDETRAAYRFFDNPRVTPQKLLQPHRQATQRRIEQQPVVLIVQDTTELDFSKHPPKDAGLLNKPQRLGLYDHTHLAVTPEGLCLGVLDVEFFSRTAQSLGKSRERAADPIETKESFRWLKGYRLACTLQAAHPHTQIVSVADCECDIYDIFLEAQRQPTPAQFVIRARVERSLPEPDPQAGPDAYHKVRAEVAASDVVARRQIELPRTPKRKARTAHLEVRAQSVRVKPPHARGGLPEVSFQVVLVEEVEGPGDGTDVRWLLITSLPIDTPQDSVEGAVLRVVDNYVARWVIEVYFRVYKTGCRVEQVPLDTVRRLQNCLLLYKLVAWRVLYVTHLGREAPELPCSAVFAEPEWQSVWVISRGQPLPAEAPALGEFIGLLARLGGYKGRRRDPPPGPQAIWIGLRRMTDFALAWTAFHQTRQPDP